LGIRITQVKQTSLTLAHLAIICLAFGCGNGASQNLPSGAQNDQSGSAVQEGEDSQKSATPSGNWEKLVMHPSRNAQGTVLVEMPFPAAWKISSNPKQGEPTIVGPNGFKVVDFPGQFFMYTSDPRMQQSYLAAGQKLRPMPGVEQLVQQDIAPWAEKRGLRFVRWSEIPEVSRMDQWYNDQLYKAMPSQMQIQAIGVDWVSTNGEPYFVLMHLNVSNGQNLQTWSYYCTAMRADKEYFEAAKKQLVFGLANARYNLKPIVAYNEMEARKAGQSWAAFSARMAQNQANFEASQRAFVNRSTGAHDALMSGWKERNAASDKAQERFVDTITERAKVVDPSSGQQYKVESGYNHYWMNADGKYLSTDKQDYDPNLDKSINNQKWQELKKTE
jgi:hypothetical protein